MNQRAFHILSAALTAVLLFSLGVSSCEEDPDEDIGTNAQISECGGFVAKDVDSKPDTSAGDCADHVLVWQYDATTGAVTFLDDNVWLNCCGDHEIAVYHRADGIYEIAEKDSPEGGEGGTRCKCMCFFDFQVTVPGVQAGPINVDLTLFITDEMEAPALMWQGTIDLREGSGKILIQKGVGYCG